MTGAVPYEISPFTWYFNGKVPQAGEVYTMATILDGRPGTPNWPPPTHQVTIREVLYVGLDKFTMREQDEKTKKWGDVTYVMEGCLAVRAVVVLLDTGEILRQRITVTNIADPAEEILLWKSGRK